MVLTEQYRANSQQSFFSISGIFDIERYFGGLVFYEDPLQFSLLVIEKPQNPQMLVAVVKV